jgi:hypothetical protein
VYGCSFEAIKLVSDAVTALSAADVHLMVWMLLFCFLFCVHELKILDT